MGAPLERQAAKIRKGETLNRPEEALVRVRIQFGIQAKPSPNGGLIACGIAGDLKSDRRAISVGISARNKSTGRPPWSGKQPKGTSGVQADDADGRAPIVQLHVWRRMVHVPGADVLAP